MNLLPRSIRIAAKLSNKPLTLDQARFTEEGLQEVKQEIGTVNIETISEKDEPEKYEKYNKLYIDHPGKGNQYKHSRRVTGIHAYKDIGDKRVIIWRDASIDDWFIVAPKGLLKTLENPNKDRINIIAKKLIAEDDDEVKLPTLQEFLNNNQRNSYVEEPGFDSFYVRKGPYGIDGEVYPKVLQIANIEASEKGQGAFSKLIDQLKKEGMPILVECILNSRLPAKLEILGFKQVNQSSGIHYFWDNAKSINASTINKEEFYKKNNIDEDEMHWLGSGDFGDAYEIGNNKVLKITKSKEEFDIAKKLINQKFDGFVDYFDAEEVNNEYMIIMEMLDTPSSIEDTFSELQSILDEQGIPITYIDQYLDTDELDLDDDMVSFISDIEDVVRSYRKMGIETGDIRSENLGYDKHNKLKAFDIFERT